METFDRSTLRDPQYRARFQAKLAEIKAVREKHTFLDYALRQNLFQELSRIYEENLAAYQKAYVANLEAFAQAKQNTEAHKAEMHPIRYRNARRLYEQIEQCLAQKAYAENERSVELIDKLNRHTEMARNEMGGWTTTLASWHEKLKQNLTNIWAEEYEQLRQQHQRIQTEIRASDKLPPLPLTLRLAEIQSAASHKQDAIASLRPKAAFSPKLSTRLQQIAEQASSLVDFKQLESRVKAARRNRILRWSGIAAALIGLIGSGIYFVPKWMDDKAESEVWADAQEANSLQSYQDYLTRYPNGMYAAQALAAQRRLPYGDLDSLTDHLGRVFQYEGELRDMQAHGKGTATYLNGATFEGYFREGMPDSSGTFTEVDGSRYEGSWKHGRRTYGKQSFSNGDSYNGSWQNDLYHGQGTLTLANGTKYTGNWVNGIKEGQGQVSWPDGATYKGQWKAGSFHGQGIYIDSVGVKYDGYWVEGKRNGAGEMIWPDSLIFEGAWKNDLREGKGTFIWVKTNAKFETVWTGDSINGPGVFFSPKPQRIELTGDWSGRMDRLRFYYGSQLHNTYKVIGHGMIVSVDEGG